MIAASKIYSAQNIYAAPLSVAAGDLVAPRDGMYEVLVELSNGDFGGVVTLASVFAGSARYLDAEGSQKLAGADVVYRLRSGPIFASAGDDITLDISSDDSSDTAVTVVARLIELSAVSNSVSDALIAEASVADAAALTTSFILSGSSLNTSYDVYQQAAVVFTSGNLIGARGRIKSFDPATKRLTLYSALPAAPANGDSIQIVGMIV